MRQALANARQAISQAVDAAQQRGRREAEVLVSQRDQELATVDQKLHSTLHEKDRWKDAEMNSAGSVFPSRLAQLRHELQTVLSSAESQYNQSLARLAEQRDAQTAESRQRYEATCATLRSEHDRAWEAMAERWLAGYETLRSSWGNIQSRCERLFPIWETTDEATWPRPVETPTALRFGQVTLDLANVKNGLPHDERLRPPRTVSLPALMTLKEHPLMVITAEEEGRRSAVDLLQAMMLRFLTAMPPGKVRFTILDPVGLGENFASFMHLADYDELLIASSHLD